VKLNPDLHLTIIVSSYSQLLDSYMTDEYFRDIFQ